MEFLRRVDITISSSCELWSITDSCTVLHDFTHVNDIDHLNAQDESERSQDVRSEDTRGSGHFVLKVLSDSNSQLPKESWSTDTLEEEGDKSRQDLFGIYVEGQVFDVLTKFFQEDSEKLSRYLAI